MDDRTQSVIESFEKSLIEAHNLQSDVIHPQIGMPFEDADCILKHIHELKETLTSHAPEGHNYTNAQYVNLLQENERLRSEISFLTQTLRGV